MGRVKPDPHFVQYIPFHPVKVRPTLAFSAACREGLPNRRHPATFQWKGRSFESEEMVAPRLELDKQPSHEGSMVNSNLYLCDRSRSMSGGGRIRGTADGLLGRAERSSPEAAQRRAAGAGLDGEGADRAIIRCAAEACRPRT